jgi:hypothetical protein
MAPLKTLRSNESSQKFHSVERYSALILGRGPSRSMAWYIISLDRFPMHYICRCKMIGRSLGGWLWTTAAAIWRLRQLRLQAVTEASYNGRWVSHANPNMKKIRFCSERWAELLYRRVWLSQGEQGWVEGESDSGWSTLRGIPFWLYRESIIVSILSINRVL